MTKSHANVDERQLHLEEFAIDSDVEEEEEKEEADVTTRDAHVVSQLAVIVPSATFEAVERPNSPLVHPLQDLVGSAHESAAMSRWEASTMTTTMTTSGPSLSSWSNSFSTNMATLASRAVASVQSVVDSSTGTNAISTTNRNFHQQEYSYTNCTAATSQNLTYQERQKMILHSNKLHSQQDQQQQQYQHQQHSHTASSSNQTNRSSDYSDHNVISPHVVSSMKANSVSAGTIVAENNSSLTKPVSLPAPTTHRSSSSSSIAPTIAPVHYQTFVSKLTSALDTNTKSKLLSSALGRETLLPGERVIMFLNCLKDVKDSRWPMMMVGSGDSMSAELRQVLLKDDGQELMDGSDCDYSADEKAAEEKGNGLAKENEYKESKKSAITTVWCCVMTFYRVVVFSYRARVADGKILFNHEEDEANGEHDSEINISNTNNGDVRNGSADNDGDNEIIQKWIQSQSVSIQFQEAHDSFLKKNRRKQYHHVFEMPLASIERVEKVFSSSQASITGIAPSSSLNTYSSLSNYPSILPSSSTVSSASSAMSHLGSQMKPLLESIASTGSNNNNSNLVFTNSSSTNAGGNSNNNSIGVSSGPLGIILHGKDGGRWIKFSTDSYTDAMRAHEALNTYAFPGRKNLGYLFAFESRRAEVMASGVQKQGEGGQIITLTASPNRRRFIPLEEFERQGIFQPRGNGSFLSASPWAPILNANASYQLCATYPSILVGPRSIVGDTHNNPINNHRSHMAPQQDAGLSLLRSIAAFRSENRFPTLTWGSATHGGSIWRSSQPKVGLQGNRSIEDEKYLYSIAEDAKRANLAADARAEGGVGSGLGKPPKEILRMLCGRNNESDLILDGANSSCMLKIMDMRPKSAAMANRTQGYGYENTNYYRGTTINFYGIGNIHAVRDAYQKVNALCISPNTSDIQWMQLVESTNWPSMTRLILSAAWQTTFHVHYNRLPVLLHCSHGWDRTSQVAALSQLMLDPYYRTISGFSTLVEKDFMSFGHPFHTRCGHGEGKNELGGDEGQLAPIFLQFLDCVFQLINQFPEYFEFSPRYLLLLSEHIYSCRFGTLLCDSEREREVVAGIRQRTYCLWEYLESVPELINPMFNRNASENAGVLLMPLPMLLRNVTLWTDRLCMYGAKATIPCDPPKSQSTAESQKKEPMILHTTGDTVEKALHKALEEVNMWRIMALSALKEVEQLKKSSVDSELTSV